MFGKILIVDDDIRINDMLKDTFEMEGCDTVSAFNGQEALDVLETEKDIDVVLLDIMMPVLDGWDIIGYIKENYSVRVIMVTALTSEKDELRGLKSGADDYVSKPFNRAILVEKVRKYIDEKHMGRSLCYLFSGLIVNPNKRLIKIDGKEISVTNKEYEILVLLMDNCAKVMDRDTITARIWGIDADIEMRNVDTQIKMLRRSLGVYGKYIITARGVGYYFDGEVKRVEEKNIQS